MIKEIEVNGKKYEINTTPENKWQAEIHRYEEVALSGTLAEVLKELNGNPVLYRNDYFEISDEETVEIAMAAGYKFSRSKQWQRLIDWAGYKQDKQGV